MKGLLSGPIQKATAAAASLTGKRFSMLVASSLIATTGVVAVGLSGNGGISPMAAAAAKALLEEENAVVASAPAPVPSESTPASSPEAASSAGAASSGPLPSPASAPDPAPAPEPETPEAPPTEPEAPEPGPIQHVFLVSVASPGYDAAFGSASQMPYLSGELRTKGVLLTNYSLLDTAPLPNGIATVGGQPPTAAAQSGCPTYEACLQEVETLTLPDQMAGARLSWHGYFEAMADAEGKADNCVHPEPEAADVPTAGGYSSLLNPFVFFHSLLDLGDCDENDVPFDELAKDLKKTETTANFSYISPNLCNAGFREKCPEGAPAGAAAADAFLARVVPEIIASPAYKKDGLLIVSFGAADPDPAAPPSDPKKVGAVLLSPLLAPGATDGAPYNPYSVLRSIDELFNLEPLASAGGAKVRSFASAITAGNGGD
ncbi:MAG TPA: alkaline phosphatase family protein [Solirubrobacterales bacterium]|nr:alkaline phosphatase family protein [Solirubrobacterales bacterium]